MLVGPAIMRSGRTGVTRAHFYAAILVLALAEALIRVCWHSSLGLYAALTLFFVAFNFLEASLPGVISRAAPAASKGAALGAYSTFQFIGVFLGGLFGGLVAGQFDYIAVPLACSLLALSWLLYTLRLPATALTRTVSS